MKFAVTVDGEKKDNIPESAIGNGNKYYEVTANCDEGITAEWDYNAWNLKVDNITKGTKCTLAFNSKLTEADYKKYIEAGVAYRRNTYRGKDITSKLEDGTLFSEISSGKFDDIFVGDYIISPTSKKTSNLKDINSQTVVWLIADLDNYLNTGCDSTGLGCSGNNVSGNYILKKHHATIIPAVPLTKASMNSTGSTEGGYVGSQMYTTTLTQILNKYIVPDFGESASNHIIEYSSILSDKIEDSRISRDGSPTGASSQWNWYTRKLDLMSEMNVFGSIVWSSSGMDTGIDNRQYAIFKLKPEFINSYNGNIFNYWLKDVASSNQFASASDYGLGTATPAGTSRGVRPRFLID